MTRFMQYGCLLAGVWCPGLLLAQTKVSWGPCLGGNVATVRERKVVYYDSQPNPAYVAGPQLGVLADIRFGKLAVQPQVVFTQKGYRYEIAQSPLSAHEQYDLRLYYVQLPLHAVYTTGRDHGFQVFAGPFLGVGVGGRERFKTERRVNNTVLSRREQTQRVLFGTEFRRVEAGCHAGIGYRVARLQGQVGYGVGLTNLFPDNRGGSRRNRTLQLSVAYLFAAKQSRK